MKNNKSIEIFPSDVANYYRGFILEALGRHEEAIDSLNKSSAINQNYVCDDLIAIGICYRIK